MSNNLKVSAECLAKNDELSTELYEVV